MCGFVGVVRSAGRGVRRGELEALDAPLVQRGPDGTGTYVDGEIGLLSTRLAIQGGHEGDQPARSRDGRFLLAYNGELFASHRRLLRGALRAEGAGEVRATSDTELLLAWLSHRLAERRPGDSVPAAALSPLCGGMYAFALVDLVLREAILHADGGVKPLYVVARPDAGETWFASTITPLLGALRPRLVLDPAELARRLVSPVGRGTLFAAPPHVEEVLGRTGIVRASEPGVVRWVSPATEGRRRGSPTAPATAPALDEVREAFAEAAAEAAETTGPVTILLSGGLDSAGVAAWCGRPDALALTGRFGPEGGPYDESGSAREVAGGLGLRHQVVDLLDRDLLLDLPDVVDALEDVVGGPGSLAIHRLAHRARAHGRVALSGTGGDEHFAGYTRIALALGRAGPWTQGYDTLAARMSTAGTDPRRRWLAAVDRADDLLPWLDPAFRATVPLERARAEVFEDLFGAHSGTASMSPARALVTAEERTSLRMLLRVEDRITMALALESRPVPCLGRVPAVAARLPEAWLVGADGEGKRALRAALAGRIPESVRCDRMKRGFPTPFHRAATGAGRDVAEAVLSSRRFAERGWWNVEACRRLLDDPRPGHDRALFSVLSHETWARRFLDGEVLASTGARAGGAAP